MLFKTILLSGLLSTSLCADDNVINRFISKWKDEWYITKALITDIEKHSNVSEYVDANKIIEKAEKELRNKFKDEEFVRQQVVVYYKENKPIYSLAMFRQTDSSTHSMQKQYNMLKCVVYLDGTIVLPALPTDEDKGTVPRKGVNVPALRVPNPENP